ncbi:IS3 family transposase [Corynebacterium diphtheriae bv. mitis]|nr:IS3 family transposase [Corynebacterium diphtheriae bv. mitis]
MHHFTGLDQKRLKGLTPMRYRNQTLKSLTD